MSVSRNEVMICGALIFPCEYYPQMNLQWSTIFSSLGGSPWFPPQAIPSVTRGFLPSALSDRAYPYQARFEDRVSDPGLVDKVLFCSCGLV